VRVSPSRRAVFDLFQSVWRRTVSIVCRSIALKSVDDAPIFVQHLLKFVERRTREDSFLHDDQRETPPAVVHRQYEFVCVPVPLDVVIVVRDPCVRQILSHAKRDAAPIRSIHLNPRHRISRYGRESHAWM